MVDNKGRQRSTRVDKGRQGSTEVSRRADKGRQGSRRRTVAVQGREGGAKNGGKALHPPQRHLAQAGKALSQNGAACVHVPPTSTLPRI